MIPKHESDDAFWTNDDEDKAYTEQQVMETLDVLIDIIYFTCGDRTFRQKIGIPMGTDCAPLLANLYLFALECKWMDKNLTGKDQQGVDLSTAAKKKAKIRMRSVKNAHRYIDDLVLLNSKGHFTDYIAEIYPATLVLERQGKKDSDGHFLDNTADFLDTKIDIENGLFITKLYDKRNDFNFPIVKFQFTPSNYSTKQAENILFGQCTRYARICHFYHDFKQCIINDTKHMTKHNKLCQQSLQKVVKKYCYKHRNLLYTKYQRDGAQVVKDCFPKT